VQRSSVHDVLNSSGRPLDQATRTEMEARLGADFSDVRVHRDEAARASAAEIGARAYTSGNHIVIGEGGDDRHTLAHELTHVIQQRRGPVAGSDNGQGLSVSDPHDRFEREAEAVATRVTQGGPPLPRHAEAPAAPWSGPVGGTLQRRVSVTDPRSPERKRELSDERSVRSFLEQHGISIREMVARRLQISPEERPALLAEFRANGTIRDLVTSDREHSYEDSKAGAQQLAHLICAHVVMTLTVEPKQSAAAVGQGAAPAPQWPSAAHSPMDALKRTSQQQPGTDGVGHTVGGPLPEPSSARTGAGAWPGADQLSQLARQEMAKRTPENPFLTGLGSGAQSAVTGRVGALSEPIPSGENFGEVARWGAWLAQHGEAALSGQLDKVTDHMSPQEAEKLKAQYNATLAAKKQELAGSIIGSGAAGTAIGTLGNLIPHPGARTAAKATSTVLGGLAAAQKVGKVADAIKDIEQRDPQTYAKLQAVRDKDLRQTASRLSETSRKATLEQVENLGNLF
jgi:hypothetical protein